jgi:hypothetical protein
VAHIEINTTSVAKKSAVAGRLLVIAMMPIECADPDLFEKMILHARRPRFAAALILARHKAAVFRFQSNDAVHKKVERC